MSSPNMLTSNKLKPKGGFYEDMKTSDCFDQKKKTSDCGDVIIINLRETQFSY